MNYLKQVVVAFLWGSTFIAGNVAARSLPSFTVAFLRFVCAALTLLAVVYASGDRLPRLSRRELWLSLGMAASGMALYNLCFISGLRLIEASRASMIIALNPVAVALFSALLFKERLRPLQWLGVAIASGGAMFIISGGRLALLAQGFGPGELCILGGMCCWVCYTFLGKLAMKTMQPLQAVTWAAILAVALLALPAAGEGCFTARLWQDSDWRTLVSLFVLGALGTAVAFTWYYQSVSLIGPTATAVFIPLNPMFATVMAFFLLGERPARSFFLGAALIVLGVLLTNNILSPKRS